MFVTFFNVVFSWVVSWLKTVHCSDQLNVFVVIVVVVGVVLDWGCLKVVCDLNLAWYVVSGQCLCSSTSWSLICMFVCESTGPERCNRSSVCGSQLVCLQKSIRLSQQAFMQCANKVGEILMYQRMYFLLKE